MEKSQTADNMAAHQRILHQPSSNLTADYWKSEHDGLVSDGTPWLNLKRLQTEITKVISLREIDPMAMLSLLESEHLNLDFQSSCLIGSTQVTIFAVLYQSRCPCPTSVKHPQSLAAL